jgi:hypothetical protein
MPVEEQKILDAVRQAREKNLWGEITIRFEWGKPILMQVLETTKFAEKGNARDRYNGR